MQNTTSPSTIPRKIRALQSPPSCSMMHKIFAEAPCRAGKRESQSNRPRRDGCKGGAMSYPRIYNAAVDMVDRNVAEGRASKPVFIDPHETLTYAELATRCNRMANL